MNARTAGRSNVPYGSAAHDVDLVLRDTVDVLDDPEVAAVDVADGHPDHLVPVHLAAREVTHG